MPACLRKNPGNGRECIYETSITFLREREKKIKATALIR
jgi:hypothetical protein